MASCFSSSVHERRRLVCLFIDHKVSQVIKPVLILGIMSQTGDMMLKKSLVTSGSIHTAALSLSGLDSEDAPVRLAAQDFSAALENFRPSVSDQELLRYRNIHRKLSAA